jgi:uncharacterized membrane protein YcaP (DUF421 family)
MDTSFLYDMFSPGAPILEKVIRSLLVYFFLVVALRLAGKRELAQLTPFDFVVLLILSNAVQNAIIGNDNSITGGLVSALVLLLTNYLVARFLFSHQKAEKVLDGKEDVLIDHGRILYSHLKRELITLAYLEMAAHKQGFAYLQDIEHATIEPGGGITFIGKKPPADETRHREIMGMLERLAERVDGLQGKG